MPQIEISEAQAAAIEDLQEQLAAEFLGAYGIVRPQDALQYLLDYHAAGGDVDEAVSTTGAAAAADAGGDAAAAADADAGAEPGDRLEAMMSLLSTHDDKWAVSDSEEGGKYVVELPDGKSMHVRTKDDVRGLLFKHYA